MLCWERWTPVNVLSINNLYYPTRQLQWILYVQNKWVKENSKKVYDDDESVCEGQVKLHANLNDIQEQYGSKYIKLEPEQKLFTKLWTGGKYWHELGEAFLAIALPPPRMPFLNGMAFSFFLCSYKQ